MKKNRFSILMLTALSVFAFSCTEEEIEQDTQETPEVTTLHRVEFKTGLPTKTSVAEGTEGLEFSWNDSDVESSGDVCKYFYIQENGVDASSSQASLNEGLVTITAEYEGTSAPYTYTGFFSKNVNASGQPVLGNQISIDGEFDTSVDILIAKPLTSEDNSSSLLLQFKRVISVNQMTLKGLTAGSKVSKVEISADKEIAGPYDVDNDEWSLGSNKINIDVMNDEMDGVAVLEDGTLPLYFAIAPVEDVILTVVVTTDSGIYKKTFARTISFEENVTTTFGVNLSGCKQYYRKVTEEPVNWSGTYLIVYEADVYEADNAAFNGGLETLDAVSNKKAVTISEGTIEQTKDIDAACFAISSVDGGYSIKSASGYYIGQTSDANGLKASTSIVYVNSISLDEDKNANIVSSGGAYLRFNSASDQDRFRYYKSSTYSSQKAIALFVLDGTAVPSLPSSGISYGTTSYSVTLGDAFTKPTLNNPNNVTVTYSSDNVDVVSVDEASGDVTIKAEGTATITATFAGNETFKKGTASYTIEVKPAVPENTSTSENPYTPEEAIELANKLDGSTTIDDVYVKGIVSQITTAFNPTYGNISYNISSDGKQGEGEFALYRGVGLDGNLFASADDLNVGDLVVVKGTLANYNGTTPQLGAGNYLISIKHLPKVSASPTSLSFTKDGGSQDITVSVNDFTGTPTITASVPSEYTSIFETSIDGLKVTVTAPASSVAARSTTLTIMATYGTGEGEETAETTVELSQESGETLPDKVYFYESFDKTSGTGGRDNNFSGNVGTSKVTPDETWTTMGQNGAYQCIKLGTSSNSGTVKTGKIELNGSGTLTFSAAGWGDSNTNTLTVTAEGATLSGDTSVTLTNGSWKEDYKVNISGAEGEVYLSFSIKRGFLDDVFVFTGNPTKPTEKIDPAFAFEGGNVIFTLNDEDYKAFTGKTVTMADGVSVTPTYELTGTAVGTVDPATGVVTLQQEPLL